MARRRFLHDVEMVEEDDLDAGPVAPSEPLVGAPPTRGRRRALTSGVAALVVVAVGAVAAQVVTDRRREAHVAAVGALPHAVEPLRGPPAPLWDMPSNGLSDVQVRAGDDLLVGVQSSMRGPVRAVALDVRTGEPAWEVELLDGEGRPEPDGDAQDMVGGSGSCVALPRDEHHVACLAHDGLTMMTAYDVLTLPASAVRVVVLDTRDGSVTSDLTRALSPTAASSLAAVGDVVAVVDAEPDADTGSTPWAVRITTWDGESVWAATLPDASRPGPRRAQVEPLGDLLAVVTTTEVTVFDTRATRVRSVPVPENHSVRTFDSHTMYVGPGYGDVPFGNLRTEEFMVVRPSGDIEVTGELVPASVDDGSASGLVLTMGMGGMLHAWGDDGASRWSTKLTPAHGVLLLDGRLHLGTGTEVVTLDARTGEELWRSGATGEALLTDGRHLLAIATPEPDAPPELVALDLTDGAERWRSPLPPSTAYLIAHLNLLTAVWWRDTDQPELGVTVLG